MADIKAGDVVELKSGGPKMTVEKVGPHNGVERAFCEWFDGNENKIGGFPVTSLKHVEK
jgi:uncharacterized protein YodC (DUF2158 family)